MTRYQQEVFGDGRYDPIGGVVLKRTKRQSRQRKGGKCIKRRGGKGEGVPKYMRETVRALRPSVDLVIVVLVLIELLCEKSIGCGRARGMAGAWADAGGEYTIYDKSQTAREMRYCRPKRNPGYEWKENVGRVEYCRK